MFAKVLRSSSSLLSGVGLGRLSQKSGCAGEAVENLVLGPLLLSVAPSTGISCGVPAWNCPGMSGTSDVSVTVLQSAENKLHYVSGFH